MKLKLIERLTILQILPHEGNFATLNIVRTLKETLAPTEEEFKKFEIIQDADQTKWNEKGKEELELKIGEKATDVIVEALEKLDKEKKITAFHLSIYEKFVKNKD